MTLDQSIGGLDGFFSPLRHIVYDDDDLAKNHPKFGYRGDVSDGSLIIGLVDKHGIEKLIQVLNFHSIENKHNILDVFQKSTYIDKLMLICKPNEKKPIDATPNSFFDHYSSILEYFIISRTQKEIEYIIDEMQIDPRKIKWDYANKILTFGKKTNPCPEIDDIVFSTIMKIIVDGRITNDEWCDQIITDNIIRLLGQYLFNS